MRQLSTMTFIPPNPHHAAGGAGVLDKGIHECGVQAMMRFIACCGMHKGMLFVCVVALEIPVWLREYVESSKLTVPLSCGRDSVRMSAPNTHTHAYTHTTYMHTHEHTHARAHVHAHTHTHTRGHMQEGEGVK